MGKSRLFSIYLLKNGFDNLNALKDEHKLQLLEATKKLPKSAKLYILDNLPKPPWWKSYFGIQENLDQVSKGALIFLPVKERCIVLSFGHAFHNLKDDSYEYDFGLKVTLNSIDPLKIKSTDVLDPSTVRRKRTQIPMTSELTYFDFDSNSEIIKTLTGAMKNEYQIFFKHATGSSSLKISLKISAEELTSLCETLLDLYDSDAYESSFPGIHNISPIKDPVVISKLDSQLLIGLQNKNDKLFLTIPDIIDYRDNLCCRFKGSIKPSEVYSDISLEQFYEYLGNNYDLFAIDLKRLKNFKLILTDSDGQTRKEYSIYNSLVYEAKIENDNTIYHFCDGLWYQVDLSYVEQLKDYLDSRFEESDLCAYNHDEKNGNINIYSEGNYNKSVPLWQKRFICLDRTDIRPPRSTAIEPCDLYSVVRDESAKSGYRALFYHVKISERSSLLSHLFSQGINSIQLILQEKMSCDKLKKLIIKNLGDNDQNNYLLPFDGRDFKVIFAIISKKDAKFKSTNLPLFSQITLMRNMKILDLMNVKSSVIFIDDQSKNKKLLTKDKKEQL